MAQLSRPYQLGLAGIVLLAAAWLVLIQGHSASPASSASVAPATTVTAPASKAPAASTSGHAANGTSLPSAPGVAGLTRAIDKARGAVSISQKNSRQLEEKSAQASAATTSTSATSTPAAASAAPAQAVTPAASTPGASSAAAAPKPVAQIDAPRGQRAVEAQLAQGKVALILFWNPKGADDMAIHRAIAKLHSRPGMRIAVNEAPASAIASFGTITRGIQVYGTPTLLIVNKKGQTITLTGPQDAFAITQAIQEARSS